MDSKTLILFFADANRKNIIIDELNSKKNTTASCVFKPVGVIGRLFRKIHLYSKLPGIDIWMLDWKKQLSKYDKIICIASPYSAIILSWIKRRNKKIRCINYFWDSVEISKYPVKKGEFENWSFFDEDCKKYDMSYNPQFFISSILLPDKKITYDITYVGADRGGMLTERTKLLNFFDLEFSLRDIRFYAYYVTDSQAVSSKIRQSKLLSEKEFHDISAKGKTILDLVEPEIQWMTLRPLLALSNNKKLITNNHKIKFEPFYNPNNVFILGQDNLNYLKEFIDGEFSPLSREVLAFYESESWLERFDVRKERLNAEDIKINI